MNKEQFMMKLKHGDIVDTSDLNYSLEEMEEAIDAVQRFMERWEGHQYIPRSELNKAYIESHFQLLMDYAQSSLNDVKKDQTTFFGTKRLKKATLAKVNREFGDNNE